MHKARWIRHKQDDAEAWTQACNTASEGFAGIPKKSVAISERLTDSAWKFEVHYGAEQVSSGGSGDGVDENDKQLWTLTALQVQSIW